MRRNILFILLLMLTSINQLFAQEQNTNAPTATEVAQPTMEGRSTQDLFQEGIKLYQSHNYANAQKIFERALIQDPRNAFIRYNLGLNEFKLGNIGKARGYLMQALYLSPRLKPAETALQFINEQNPRKDLARQILLWEQYRSRVLSWLRLNDLAIIGAFFLLLSGILVSRFLGSRRSALQAQEKVPSLPIFTSLLTLVTLLVMILFVSKAVDSLTPRAVVITKTVEVKTGPEETQATLFELFEGLEVIVQESKDGWIQITYPGGLSGWIPSAAIMQVVGI